MVMQPSDVSFDLHQDFHLSFFKYSGDVLFFLSKTIHLMIISWKYRNYGVNSF